MKFFNKFSHILAARNSTRMADPDPGLAGGPRRGKKTKELDDKERMLVVTGLFYMMKDNALRRGSINKIARDFQVSRCTIRRIWQRACAGMSLKCR